MDEKHRTTRLRFWLSLVRLVGLIVPRRLRADWRQEWEAELRYREEMLAEWDKLNWQTKLNLLWRSTSAFWDALWLQPKRWEDDMFQDLRYGIRMLLKHKGFTAVAVLSLALGIGANTAIFSLINALMLRMLPVKDAQELVLFKIVGPLTFGYNSNYPLYEMYRDRNQSFTGIITGANVGRARFLVNAPEAEPESVQQQRVSGNFFSVLGVNPIVGRTLTEADDSPANTQPGAVISYEFWQRRFGADPTVVGRQVTVNKTSLTIVGVAPPGFFGFEVGTKPEIWWPIKVLNDPNLSRDSSHWIRVIGRLRPGVSVAQAQADVELIFQQQVNDVAATRGANWSPTQRRNYFERHISLEAGGAGYTGLRQQFRQPLLILMATVGLVLLIACVNVANLLLARAATRRKEIAVRLALGAGRFRLLRQLLTESVLLSLLGGAAGLLFARVCLRALVTYLPQQAQTGLDVAPDARVFAFTLAVSVLTGVLFGLVPAWQATRLNLTASLKDQTGGSTGGSRLRLNKTLVVTQVALSLFLLVGAGLFVRSLRNLQTLDVGMNYDNIVQFSLDLGGSYNAQQRSDFYKQLLPRLEALPGVQSATLLYFSLLSGGGIDLDVSVPGYAAAPDEKVACNVMAVGPRFFETMKMPILAGRDFGPQDERPVATSTPPVDAGPQSLASALPQSVVINQAMARYFFGKENPVGKRFSLKGNGQPYEIIGVTQDAKYVNLREQPPRTFYPYYFQLPDRGNMTLQFRTSNGTADYGTTIRQLVRELNPQTQVVGLQMMSDVVNESLVQERFLAQLGSAFSLFALLLACIGLYGVMSYTVARRTSEIGIRMALGAQPFDVVRLVLREVFLLVVLGVGIGLTAALATMRYVSTLLFDLAPNDPLTITVATLLMVGIAVLAGYLPARRAAQVDPLVALRHE
jgi:predicted permease